MVSIPRERPDLHSPRRAPSDWIGQIELARLAAQQEDRTAAAIARVGLLLLKRLDQLSVEREGAA